MRTFARVENFRDRSSPNDAPSAPPDQAPDRRTDTRTDTAADRADAQAIRFPDDSRVRRADLELRPDDKPPPDAAERLEAYDREYKKQLSPAVSKEDLLPDEIGDTHEPVEQGPIADKARSALDKARITADKVLGGDKPDEASLKVDRPESNDPYAPRWQPNEYKPDALNDKDGERKPLFDRKPERDDTAQGRVGDCGVIATAGAVAGASPDKISDAMKQNPDGTYSVRLYRATSAYDSGTSKPGQPYTYTVTPDLPVQKTNGQLTGAKADKVAWPAIMEKAIAGSDQAWTPEQKQAYEARWDVQKDAKNRELIKAGKQPLPDGPVPSGYVRLNQGTNPWDRAELLTSITGRQSEVREIPDNDDELIKGIFTDKLAYDKPVLVGSRPLDQTNREPGLPHGLYAKHVYEVTALTNDGRIELRNPWNKNHPDPLTPDQFREYFRRKNADGSRIGRYTTLT